MQRLLEATRVTLGLSVRYQNFSRSILSNNLQSLTNALSFHSFPFCYLLKSSDEHQLRSLSTSNTEMNHGLSFARKIVIVL